MPEHRWRSSSKKRFFINDSHRLTWLTARREANWRGKGGTYGKEWQNVAAFVRCRDRVCQHCGKTPIENGGVLDAHHIVPYRVSMDNDPSNLIALCRHCHLLETHREDVGYPPYPGRTLVRTCIHCGTQFEATTPYQKCCHSEQCDRERQSAYSANYWRREAKKNSPAYQKKRQTIAAYQAAHKGRVHEQKKESEGRCRETRKTRNKQHYEANREAITQRQREAYRQKREAAGFAVRPRRKEPETAP